jgi:hypothetical protein
VSLVILAALMAAAFVPVRMELQDGRLGHVQDTFLTKVSNMKLNATCWRCAAIESEWSKDAACLWHSVFRPADAVLAAARTEFARLYPYGPSPYVAVHLRLGGLTGEEGIPGVERGLSPLPNFIAGAQCAVKLADRLKISLAATPVLVVTDNHRLRQGLKSDTFGNMVAPQGLPVHLDHAVDQSLAAHRNTIVNMVLLGWAECIVTSRSGYSLHAWLYGGATDCFVPFTSCL